MTQITPEARERLAKAYGDCQYAKLLRTKATDEHLDYSDMKALSAIQEVLDEQDGLIDRLADAENAPWPQWADDIRKKLMEYGYDGGPENEWNIGECMESWIDGCLENETAKIDALTAERDTLRLRIKALEEVLRPFASCGSLYIKTTEDSHPIVFTDREFDDTDPPITVGDLRRAAEAVGGGE